MHECFRVFLRVTEFTPPMSRRRVTNRRELLLPSLIPDRHQIGVVFDACVAHGPAARINDQAGDSPDAGVRHGTQCRPAKQISQTTEGAIAELIAGNPLLARLIFQRIRANTQSGMRSDRSYAPDEFQGSKAPSAPLDVPFIKCAEAPVLAPSAIETLFTQLARRQLPKRATEGTR
jgi:hypothetical protein